MSLCDGCFKCHAACADAHPDKDGQSCRKIRKITNPVNNSMRLITDACKHCEEPICANNCPQFAISRDEETGFMIVDEDKCIGCKICSLVCPHDIPKFVNGKMLKCDGCNDLVKAGKLPACVAACDKKALRLVDDK